MCKDDNLIKGRSKAKPLKSDKRYKDAPRFKVIYGYEDDFKLSFKKNLIEMQKELVSTIIKIGNRKRKNK